MCGDVLVCRVYKLQTAQKSSNILVIYIDGKVSKDIFSYAFLFELNFTILFGASTLLIFSYTGVLGDTEALLSVDDNCLKNVFSRVMRFSDELCFSTLSVIHKNH